MSPHTQQSHAAHSSFSIFSLYEGLNIEIQKKAVIYISFAYYPPVHYVGMNAKRSNLMTLILCCYE